MRCTIEEENRAGRTKVTVADEAYEVETSCAPSIPSTPSTPETNITSGSDDTDNIKADLSASPGSLSHMMGLFAPPLASNPPRNRTLQSLSSHHSNQSKLPPVAQNSPKPRYHESAPLLGFHDYVTPESKRGFFDVNTLSSLSPFGNFDKTPVTSFRSNCGQHSSHDVGSPIGHVRRLSSTSHVRIPSVNMPSISESNTQKLARGQSLWEKSDDDNRKTSGYDFEYNDMDETPTTYRGIMLKCTKNVIASLQMSTTYIGSFVYLQYHIIFCLALGSAIMRPNSSVSILGLMTKTAALGTLFASPIYWVYLSQEIPALYPTVDLFLAPFLAKLALIVDEALASDPSVSSEENDAVFLASFGVLTAIGTAMSACLILAASIFRLANLGSYLPYPVICGFFAAVGILTWTLAISVDTGGETIGSILTSHDWERMRYALIHHVPTIVVAGFMKYLGPRNPLFICLIVMVTIALFYLFMFFTGKTLGEMKDEGWFWSHNELVYENYASTLGFDIWAPPAPLGVPVVLDQVHWGAVWNGLSTTVAMSFLYLIRCSVHGAALKKNIPNLSRRVSTDKFKKLEAREREDENGRLETIPRAPPVKSRKFSEAVDIEAIMSVPLNQGTADETNNGERASGYQIIRGKSTNISLKFISVTYAWTQLLVAFVGGFAILPGVCSSPTMYSLGADGLSPQIGSVLLLLIFYLTDFQIVGYIPKPAFSSMLVLTFIDMIYAWFYMSFFKINDKTEWLVIPIIVVCAFALDLLSAVFVGIAFSTFIFVGSFFRSGVVKYTANGQIINSTIERPFPMAEWLNENGDRIQVMCLQNYLFFGNASSIYNYVFELFESNKIVESPFLQPKSKFLLLDLTLVTGMDTSTVDVFSDIRNLCGGNNCKLFMAGMSSNIRSILELGGVKPDMGVRSKRRLRFFARLDTALGKAEDILLELDYGTRRTDATLPRPESRRLMRRIGSGFQKALRHIDIEHGDKFSRELAGFEKYTTMIELQPGDELYKNGTMNRTVERGLFFIEVGILKVERDTGHTATRRGSDFINDSSSLSLGGVGNTKMGTTTSKSLIDTRKPSNVTTTDASETQTFRLARLGVGW
eukprot:CAMPEP_0197192470 /NCGR_PEP_ID=MMETSP1423-20130617/25121_1 /TAXON_ID=476441 /ORGANISM="Pseudo-nitzschia heimii, Strain UNC1101" /LENGTH=1092 /DNA_ID=CAMNT_0042645353 /DNA_START=98 /DNA_END=3373 /DNA_ORIENTATION=-